MIVHGLNMVNKFAPYDPGSLGFNLADARFLAANGFDTVRLGIIWKALEPQPGVYDDAYLARIAATARLLADNGIFPFIDFHQDMYNERFDGEGAPDWAVQDDGLPNQPDEGFPNNYFFMSSLWRTYDHFWNNDPGPGGVGLQDRYAAAWAHVAAYFAAEPRILGYDIFNEPFPGSQWTSCANPQTACPFDAELTAFNKRVFAAIRRVDPRHTLYYEPNVEFNFGAQTGVGDPGDPNSGMDFHVYCLGQSLPAAGEGASPPGSAQGCPTAEQLPFTNADQQAKSTGGALLVSEFGATDDLAPIERVVDDADQHLVGWIEWAFWNRDPCCPRPIEGIVKDISRPPTPDNVKADKLAVLARPYPTAVAGTPESIHYDVPSRRFDLVFAPSGVAGRPLAPGALTEVVLPPVQYPRGYVVASSGAQVVSAPGAGVLEVRALAAATRVTLHVTPAAGTPGVSQTHEGGAGAGRSRSRARCRARRVTIALPRRAGRIVSARVFVDGRRVARLRGRNLRRVTVHTHAGTSATRVRVLLVTASGRRLTRKRRLAPCPRRARRPTTRHRTRPHRPRGRRVARRPGP